MTTRVVCRRAQELISWRLDRPLGDEELAQLAQHLQTCEPCRRVQAQLQLLRHALTRLDD